MRQKIKTIWTELFSQNYVTPKYGYKSIADLVRIFEDSEVKGFKEIKDFIENRRNIFFFIVDSLGLNLIAKGLLENLIEKAYIVDYATSILPSTTATALASLATGKTPFEHGIIGYRIFLKEAGSVAKVLSFTPAFSETREELRQAGTNIRLLKTKTIFEKLKIKSFYIGYKGHENSTYTEEITRGSKFIPINSLYDLLYYATKALKKKTKTLVYGYWGKLDDLSHAYGPFSTPVNYLLTAFEKTFNMFLKTIPQDSAVIVTADHGQIPLRGGRKVRLDKTPGLLETLVLPPYGEKRFTYLYVKDEEKFKKIYNQYLAETSILKPVKEIIPLLGGTTSKSYVSEIGTHVLISKKNHIHIYPYSKKEIEDVLRGHHGGMSPHEMLVPVLAFTRCV